MPSKSFVKPLRVYSEFLKTSDYNEETVRQSLLATLDPSSILTTQPRSKRQKMSPLEDTDNSCPLEIDHQEEHILLINRSLYFSLDQESACSLSNILSLISQSMDITMSVDIKTILNEHTKEPSHMQIYRNNSNILLFTLKIIDPAFLDVRKDFAWVSEIRDDHFLHKPLLQDHYESISSLHFVKSTSEEPWQMQLVTKVTVRAADTSYFEYGFQLTRTKWWELLAYTLPRGRPDGFQSETVSVKEFYSSVHVPNKKQTVPEMEQSHSFTCKLMPFQKRAIQWMLQREGVDIHPDHGNLIPYLRREANGEPPPTFFENTDQNGNIVYVSHIMGIACKDLETAYAVTQNICGGILAEEMGLGKTVESIGLICLHRRAAAPGSMVQDRTRGKIKTSGATLIVTPPSIMHQWKTEFEKHAPGMKVLVYDGMKKMKDEKPLTDIVKEILQYDVVLTTYCVLASEIHYTNESPKRSYRKRKVYEPKRSPLVSLSWWRVLLDEAQMIEGGYSNAARVAREIPRVNCWAVSGTPIKKDINDCYGLLLFLKYEPFASNKDAWQRLLQYNHVAFKSLFKSLTLRHSKDLVRSEIDLPSQCRVVVTVPFSHVEEQNYRWLFQEMCRECGLDEEGAPNVDGWDIENHYDKMRQWLTRLRQTCLHPEAGTRNKKALGSKNGPVRTVEEVLQVMADKQITKLRADQREIYMAMIRRGQLYDQNKQHERALMIWHEALEHVKTTVTECRGALAEELRNEEHKIQAEDPDSSRVSTARQRINGFLELQHSCYFWIATANHQLKAIEVNYDSKKKNNQKIWQYSTMESEYYELAKCTRLELTSVTRTKAVKLIDTLDCHMTQKKLSVVPMIESLEIAGGIEVQTTFNAVDDLTIVLNEQTELLYEWRDRAVKLLIEPLFDTDKEEADGNENERAVEENEETYAYITAIRGLLADREQLFTGQKNTNVAIDVANLCENNRFVHRDKFQYLIGKKNRLNLFGAKNMKTLLSNLRTHIIDMDQQDTARTRVEAKITNEFLKTLKEIQKVQVEACNAVSREVDLMRSTLNARIDFYRQVQVVSDTLLEIDIESEFPEGLSKATFDNMEAKEAFLNENVLKDKAKTRYLNNLKTAKAERSPDCLICRETYEFGTLTSCGHSFCSECLASWFKTARTCPDCRSKLRKIDLFNITYRCRDQEVLGKADELQIRSSTPSTPSKLPRQIYANVDDTILRDIKNIQLRVHYGSKIDAITRHILWLKQNEPNFKAVIFSQWSDVLEIIREAFAHAGICYASLARKESVRQFYEDPERSCFLLHAKSQSAGLTLVNATHVFLCEPLVNIPLELQAVSRVHRIGQTRPTTVWVYVVENSVEQAVMKLAMSRRVEMVTNDTNEDVEIALDAADSDKLSEGVSGLVESTPGGGEVVRPGDLWNCLFGAGTTEKLRKVTQSFTREIMAGVAEMRMEATTPVS